MSRTRFTGRVLAVYGVAFSFFVMATSGLMLLVAPQGRLERSIDWHLVGLDREGWEAVHNATSFAFIALGLWHLIVHWSVVKAFLIGGNGRPASHRSEALAMFIVLVVIVGSAILDLPPASWLIELNHYFKMEFWGAAQH